MCVLDMAIFLWRKCLSISWLSFGFLRFTLHHELSSFLQLLWGMHSTWKSLLFSLIQRYFLLLITSLIQIYWVMGLMVLCIMEFFETRLVSLLFSSGLNLCTWLEDYLIIYDNHEPLGGCHKKNDCYQNKRIYGRDENFMQGSSC